VNRHEIPTHLNVEDKAFAGMTMRQLMTVAVGLGLSYGAASGLPLPVPGQAAIAVVVLAAVAVVALWRPGGRPFEDWAFVLLRYWAIPRIAVWRTRKLAPEESDDDERFEVLLPDPAWMNAPSLDPYEDGGSHATR
jgi:hypothetical protein